jgi:3-oxoacid CoA-transferase subunit A
MHFYITGDCHGRFERIEKFCDRCKTSKEDVMIILGDAGINYWLGMRDTALKKHLSTFDITLFCVHGNHEARPWEAGHYEERLWNGGTVYVEPEYPNILFAKDGEIYNFNGKHVLVVGGAYSVDKFYRIRRGIHWFESEQPDDAIKAYVEEQLEKAGWSVDIVLSHTVPLDVEPVWAFIPGLDQSAVDKSTEQWLQTLYDRLTFEKWYAGHYHVQCEEKGVRIMYEDYDEICMEDPSTTPFACKVKET